MVRLVKGAYWDSEIKRAQVDGLDGYPVYTRKAYTDVAYIACARQLLAAPGQVYPQFATHNAHTLAAIHTLAGQNYYAGQYEFQCLHGMGEPLYEQVVGAAHEGKLGRPCRIYAPVGTHETLLAYLVRRLLENGANTSFVNRIADESLSLDELVMDPVLAVQQMAERDGVVGLPHPAIPLPRNLYGAARENSRGVDLGDSLRLDALTASLAQAAHATLAGRADAGHRPAAGPGPCRSATRPTATTSSARCTKPTPRRSRPHCTARRPRPPAWAATAPTASRRRAGARRRAAGSRHRPADGPADARGRQDRGQRGGRGARGGGLPALLRAAGAARFRQCHAPAAGPGAVHQPVELPAGHLHRPGGRGAGRRQRGAGQAGRADAAGRRRGGARAVGRRRAARRAAVAARARRDGGRAAGRRCARDGRDVHRLDRGRTAAAAAARAAARCRWPPGAADRRDRRAERDAGRFVGAGRAGGDRRAGLGLRQCRAALLGAARAVRAGRGRRPRVRDARRRGARAARRQPGAAGGGRGPGDRRRSPGDDPASHRDPARQGPPCRAAGRRAGRRCWRAAASCRRR